MTEQQINKFKQRLLQMQKDHQALESEHSISSDPAQLDQSSVERLSRVEAMYAQKIALETSRDREMLADSIEGGLRRIESGQFGHCFYCEKEIEIKRLEEDPSITSCSKCVDEAVY